MCRADKILSKMGEGVLPLLPRYMTSCDMPCSQSTAYATTQPGLSERRLLLPGTFGRVLECWDRKNKDYCAVKIVRNVKKYRDAAMIEVWSAEQLHFPHDIHATT